MENVVDRIRKLLALAKDKGASEHEASFAMAKASELMLKYNIDHVDDEDAPGFIESRKSPILDQKWHFFLAGAVASLFNCRAVYTDIVVCHSFVGRPANTEAAADTFEYLVQQVEGLYKQGLRAFRSRMGRLSKSSRAEFRQTFKEACALRIYQRVVEIKAHERNVIPNHRALVVIDNDKEKIEEFLANNGVEDRGKAITARKSGFGTGAGAAAGDQIQLQKGVGR